VRLLNCLCGDRIEADETEALVAAYHAHTGAKHADLPITAERWADIDAAIRRTGGWDGTTEQLNAVDVQPLTPARKDDYIAYFDGPAFADNPAWARCYCLSYHLPDAPSDFDALPTNRADRIAQIERGEASGVLAYAGDRVVGWCNASPRTILRALDRTPEFASDDPERTAAIVCYVVAPQYRGQGLSRRLLDGAVEHMRDRGFRWLDAYPPKKTRSAAGSYHGSLRMYLDAGFSEVRDAGRWVVVRRDLQA
jgi:ribosomal protein S18 acetylase RimI-like enzyme